VTATNGRSPVRRRPRRPPRPYRDSALLYGAFAVIVVVLAVVTGGSTLWAVVAAVCAFVLATGWTWRNLRKRERKS
jgi:uncharacterized membrane protein YoaK (UPF0700 family)